MKSSPATLKRKAQQNRSTVPQRSRIKAVNGEHEIEMVAPDSLTPYDRNPMQHPEEQIELIVRSIQEYGFTIPLLIDENSMILAGHGRQTAALKMKLPLVPAVRKSGLSETQKRAYIMADNKIARNGEFDWRMISEELKALDEAGFDLTLTGFRDFEFGPLLEADWTPPPISPGQLGELDTHHIIVTGAQKKWIDEAHAKLNKMSGKELQIGEALEMVCRGFLKSGK
jgi:hypothetical protein